MFFFKHLYILHEDIISILFTLRYTPRVVDNKEDPMQMKSGGMNKNFKDDDAAM